MVSILALDQQIERLERYGRSGRMAKPSQGAAAGGLGSEPSNVERFADEQARTPRDVIDSLILIMRHLREGPDWSKSFKISYADVDSNRTQTINHNLGHVPNHCVVVRRATGCTGATGPPKNFGDIRLVNATDTDATFQISKGAYKQSAVFKVCVFRGLFVPAGGA